MDKAAECASQLGTGMYAGVNAADVAAQQAYAEKAKAEYDGRDRRDYNQRNRATALEAALRCTDGHGDWETIIKAARDILAFLEG